MNLKYYYYYFTSALPSRLCDDIVRLGLEGKSEMAIIGGVQRNSDKFSKKSLQKIKQIKKQVGTLIGIGQKLLNLQSMMLVNIMVGIVILGINHMINLIIWINTVKLENYQ